MNKITETVLFVIIALFIAGMALYPAIKRKVKKEEPVQADARPAPGGIEQGR